MRLINSIFLKVIASNGEDLD